MVDADAIIRARAVPMQSELARRGVQLPPWVREVIGPCPRCGGTDRFAIHLRKQVFNCRGCEASGNVIALVQHLDRLSFADAVAMLTGRPLERRHAPPASLPPPAPKSAPAPSTESRQAALDLWDRAEPIAGTPAEQYLTRPKREGGRGLTLPPDVSPRALRFHGRVWFSDKVSFGPAFHPCLLALYRDLITDEPRAVMRTALAVDGSKIGRAALGSVGGAAVKLSDDADVTMALAIGEGLETTLAGMMDGYAPAWALGSSGAIAKFPVLAGIEALTILMDNDEADSKGRRPGHDATLECARRWLAAGREAYRATPLIGSDFNDALTAIA